MPNIFGETASYIAGTWVDSGTLQPNTIIYTTVTLPQVLYYPYTQAPASLYVCTRCLGRGTHNSSNLKREVVCHKCRGYGSLGG